MIYLLKSQRYSEEDIWMCFLDLQNARVREMVIMAVAYYHHIDYRYVGELTGSFSISFRAQPCKWGTAIFEDRIKKDPEAIGKFNVVASMP